MSILSPEFVATDFINATKTEKHGVLSTEAETVSTTISLTIKEIKGNADIGRDAAHTSW